VIFLIQVTLTLSQFVIGGLSRRTKPVKMLQLDQPKSYCSLKEDSNFLHSVC
jgi:hypothetical protein